MSAYNARLKSKEVFGFPLVSVLLMLIALVGVFLALVPPYFALNVVAGLVAVAAFILAVVFVALGDEIMFLRVRLLAAREQQVRDMLDID